MPKDFKEPDQIASCEVEEFLSLADLNEIKNSMSDKQKILMKRAWSDFKGITAAYGTREAYLVAKDGFEKGYLASFIRYKYKS